MKVSRGQARMLEEAYADRVTMTLAEWSRLLERERDPSPWIARFAHVEYGRHHGYAERMSEVLNILRIGFYYEPADPEDAMPSDTTSYLRIMGDYIDDLADMKGRRGIAGNASLIPCGRCPHLSRVLRVAFSR